MKVKGLDGRVYNWNLSGHSPLGTEQMGSSYHKKARELLASLFPADRRLEEVRLPGSSEKDLICDFYLPMRSIIIEVHGPQHYEYSFHFHRTKLGFIKHLERDRLKAEWCELNNIRYIELPHNEDSENWTKRILNGN